MRPSDNPEPACRIQSAAAGFVARRAVFSTTHLYGYYLPPAASSRSSSRTLPMYVLQSPAMYCAYYVQRKVHAVTLPIPPATLDTPVAGLNLRPGTLRDQLSPAPTLLVFLRHFG